MENYYHKIFLEHIKRNPKKTPAPKNFWPFSYQFYLCNPVKVFEAIVESADSNPRVDIKLLVPPEENRSTLASEPMPIELLSHDELRQIVIQENEYEISSQLQNGYSFDSLKELILKKKLDKQEVKKALPFINQNTRDRLILRDTDKIAEEKQKYQRR